MTIEMFSVSAVGIPAKRIEGTESEAIELAQQLANEHRQRINVFVKVKHYFHKIHTIKPEKL